MVFKGTLPVRLALWVWAHLVCRVFKRPYGWVSSLLSAWSCFPSQEDRQTALMLAAAARGAGRLCDCHLRPIATGLLKPEADLLFVVVLLHL